MIDVSVLLTGLLLGATCPTASTEIPVFNSEYAVDPGAGASTVQLEDCPEAPATDGPEVVFSWRSREEGTNVSGHWSGDYDAVVYVRYLPETASSCVSSCAVGTGKSFDYNFGTVYDIDSERATWYIIVDSAKGATGKGTLSVIFDIGNPVHEKSWGAVKAVHRVAAE